MAMPPYRTFRTWGDAGMDRYAAKKDYNERTQNKKRLRKNPELRSAASFMRTKWDKRTAAIYDGKPYKSPYGRKVRGIGIGRPKPTGQSV